MLVYLLAKLRGGDYSAFVGDVKATLPKDSFRMNCVYGEHDAVLKIKAPTQKHMDETLGLLGNVSGLKIEKKLIVTDLTREHDRS